MTKEISIQEYSEWRDVFIALLVAFGGGLIFGGILISIMSCIDFFLATSRHKKYVEKFMKHVNEMQQREELTKLDNEVLLIIKKVYSSYRKPQNKFWSKIFGERKYED